MKRYQFYSVYLYKLDIFQFKKTGKNLVETSVIIKIEVIFTFNKSYYRE